MKGPSTKQAGRKLQATVNAQGSRSHEPQNGTRCVIPLAWGTQDNPSHRNRKQNGSRRDWQEKEGPGSCFVGAEFVLQDAVPGLGVQQHAHVFHCYTTPWKMVTMVSQPKLKAFFKKVLEIQESGRHKSLSVVSLLVDIKLECTNHTDRASPRDCLTAAPLRCFCKHQASSPSSPELTK